MINEWYTKKIERNKVNSPLIDEIEEYVKSILNEDIPQITYNSYLKFYKNGVRKDFEDIYFKKRKQLTALGLYLQWNDSKKAVEYFNELLWSISNEFSWCLAAHLDYDDSGFCNHPSKTIDLFSAETAQTLSEILLIHNEKIDDILKRHIEKRIKERILEPFLKEKWEWETATHNWSAVCAGSIGITALLQEKGEIQKQIIDRVENALEYYLTGFGNDGVSLEGIGYWTYGFGYYIYYKALKGESIYKDMNKVIAIANFPEAVQISENTFVPFSDVTQIMILPSGLISYLYEKYKIKLPLIKKISSFDFDHCYRWAHVSRNLWWTNEKIFNVTLKDEKKYFEEAQWFIIRNRDLFFAIKGGNNNEPHNHNDLGSFILAIKGEVVLTDIGAGQYTADYFGSKRYIDDHTRSYWHSVPLINGIEQNKTNKNCEVKLDNYENMNVAISINITDSYNLIKVDECIRKVYYNYFDNELVINDVISSIDSLVINEGFISYIKPRITEEGVISWILKDKTLKLKYDNKKMNLIVEKKSIKNHYNQTSIVYRIALVSMKRNINFNEKFKFYLM